MAHARPLEEGVGRRWKGWSAVSYWYMWAECEPWIRDVSDLEFESFLPMPAGMVRPVKINPCPQFVLLAVPGQGKNAQHWEVVAVTECPVASLSGFRWL